MSYIEVSHQDTKIVESDEVNELYWEFFMKTWISAVDGNVAVGRLYDECYGIVEESGGGGIFNLRESDSSRMYIEVAAIDMKSLREAGDRNMEIGGCFG